jgi:peptide alpha-N-acetyltransferase
VIECYLAKASFLKHAGALGAAAAVAEHARSLDLADRYLNSICTKRLLQAGDVETAEKTVALFTRDGDQASNMFDMQCVWFENEAGRCHARAGRRGRALKYFAAVRKHYDDMEEDQFDFHQYCLRKMTLRSYVHMLRVEDTLFSRKPYREAAKSAVEVYLDLHDHPLAEAAAAEEAKP